MQTRSTLIATLFLCLGTITAHATVTTVGTCQNPKNSITTISAAIAASPASGGTVQVCPGVYHEQVTINKALTLTGLQIAGQPGVTITSPVTGLLRSADGSFSQVFVNHAGGPVNLTNVSVLGGLLNFDGYLRPISSFSFEFPAYGINYQNTSGTIDNVKVSGELCPAFIYGSGGFLYDVPGCGIGIDLANSSNVEVTVSNSSIIGAGFAGIASSGKLNAFRNIVSIGNPNATGIATTGGGQITFNTVSSPILYTPTDGFGTTGIAGGDLVQGNVVEGFSLGIYEATQVDSNNLINNAVGISGVTGNNVTDNMISADQTYADPYPHSFPPPINQTTAIDLGCLDPSLVKYNRILSAGVGIANIKKGVTLSGSNTITGIQTSSTACTQ